jgi:hypothetical protein
VLASAAPGAPLTVWVKRTDKVVARYDDIAAVPSETVAQFRRRWLAQAKLDVSPSLRLVKLGAGLPSAGDEAGATVLQPRKTLAQAGVADGSWLVAKFATTGELPV